MPKRSPNLIGQRFSTFTVESIADAPGKRRWNIRCDCGTALARTTWKLERMKIHQHCTLRAPEIAERESKRQREYAKERRDVGRCVRCPNQAEPDRTRCKDCLEKAARAQKGRYEMLRNALLIAKDSGA